MSSLSAGNWRCPRALVPVQALGQPALWGEGKEQVDEVLLEAKVSVLGG